MPQRKEMTTLLVNVITSKMLLMFPKMLITNSGNAAWIQALYNIITASLLFFIISILYKGKKNIIELASAFGGKWLKVAVGVGIFILLMMNYASIIRVFPETTKIVLLQDMNIETITIIFELIIGIGAYIGFEAIARVNYIFMPIFGGVLVICVVLLVPYYDIYHILPFFGNGPDKIFWSGFNTLSLFSDLLLLNIFLPYYENVCEAKKSGRRALAISSVIIFTIMLVYCLVYPYPASEKFMIPVYQLARLVHLGSFFSRFEPVFQFTWSIMLLLYSAIYVYALCFVLQTTFNLKYNKPLIFPVVLISGIIAVMPNSLPELIRNEVWENNIAYPIAFLLPIIFGVISRKYYGEREKRIEKR